MPEPASAHETALQEDYSRQRGQYAAAVEGQGQDHAQASNALQSMARAALERSLCGGGPGGGLSQPRRVQADRDRRQIPVSETRPDRARPRRGARRLEPDRGATHQGRLSGGVEIRAGRGHRLSTVRSDRRRRDLAARFHGQQRSPANSKLCCASRSPMWCSPTWPRRQRAIPAPIICGSWGWRRRPSLLPAKC